MFKIDGVHPNVNVALVLINQNEFGLIFKYIPQTYLPAILNFRVEVPTKIKMKKQTEEEDQAQKDEVEAIETERRDSKYL